MKKLIPILLLFIFGFTSCNSEKKKNTNAIVKKEIKHYICDNKCEGSGSDVAGVCPTCSRPYTHNQAFHDKDMFLNGPLKVESNAPNSTSAPRTPEPARNALGVWHYTCTNGCAGGDGSATACKSCGTTLTHNTLYH